MRLMTWRALSIRPCPAPPPGPPPAPPAAATTNVRVTSQPEEPRSPPASMRPKPRAWQLLLATSEAAIQHKKRGSIMCRRILGPGRY